MLAGWPVLVDTKVVLGTKHGAFMCTRVSSIAEQIAGSEPSLRQPAARNHIPLLIHDRSLARVEEHDRRAALVRPMAYLDTRSATNTRNAQSRLLDLEPALDLVQA